MIVMNLKEKSIIVFQIKIILFIGNSLLKVPLLRKKETYNFLKSFP
jgi:hypothetical protein